MFAECAKTCKDGCLLSVLKLVKMNVSSVH